VQKISSDEFEIWKENEVTKALFDELNKSIKETYELTINGFDPYKIMVQNTERNITIHTLEKILSWSPVDESK
jgi:hypothetical protein